MGEKQQEIYNLTLEEARLYGISNYAAMILAEQASSSDNNEKKSEKEEEKK